MSGNGRVTALDALRIINQLTKESLSGAEAESGDLKLPVRHDRPFSADRITPLEMKRRVLLPQKADTNAKMKMFDWTLASENPVDRFFTELGNPLEDS